MLHDVFICHASEDKASLVRPLADALRAENVDVWYDEFSLKLGDSIRRSIDKGLKQSRFGIVVLSKAFFEKQWTQYELDGLAEREMAGRDKVMLPVWHNIKHDDVMQYSPSLAGRVAANSANGIGRIVDEILDVVRPQGSPLIVARDELIEWGVTPPVITDAYWLDVASASNRSPGFGAMIPEDSIWGIWSFPLPTGDSTEMRGRRLAYTAMQMEWVRVADSDSVNLISEPQRVLDFIETMPGLYETCRAYPSLIAQYAPQLTIPGFGGELEDVFAEQYESSCKKRSSGGQALTTTGNSPLCDDTWALRSPSFGDYGADHIACEYFTGGMFGPAVSPYAHADHLFWLLSENCNWLPEDVHQFLIDGMREWGVWHWSGMGGMDHGGDWESNGVLFDAMHDADSPSEIQWTASMKDDLTHRVDQSVKSLGLATSAADICDAFVAGGFVEAFMERNERRRKRQGTAD